MSTAVVWTNGTRTEPGRSDAYGPRTPIKVPGFAATRPFHVGGDSILGGGNVCAIVGGVVVSAGPAPGLEWAGNQVLIDHGVIDGHRYWSRYRHLAKVNVRAGQTVTAGTPLGIEGSTGLAQGRHLHLEVYRDGLSRGTGANPGNTIDPRAFFLDLLAAPAIINVIRAYGDPVSSGTVHIGRADGTFEPLQPPWANNIRGILGVVFLGSNDGEADVIPTISADDFTPSSRCGRRCATASPTQHPSGLTRSTF